MPPFQRLSIFRSDPWLLAVSLVLTLLGVMMIFSSTHLFSQEKYGEATLFLQQHGISVALGIAACLCCFYLPPERLQGFVWLALGLAFFFLVLIFVPGFGVKAGGATRWLKIAGVRIGQPGEFAKIALLLYLAFSLSRKADRVEKFTVGFLPPVVMACSMVFLLMLEPDFGTSMLLLMLTGLLLLFGGVPFRFLAISALLALPIVYLLMTRSAYRLKRLVSFMDPMSPENIKDGGFQLVQSLNAFAAGGFWGVGLGQSQQKLGHLPEAHTDFIFAIVGEELGLFGVLIILSLFFFLFLRGLRIAMRTHDRFCCLLALGLTGMIGFQTLINVGVVMGALPTKGMPLPFLSFARSSIIIVLASIGILLRIEAETRLRAEAFAPKPSPLPASRPSASALSSDGLPSTLA